MLSMSCSRKVDLRTHVDRDLPRQVAVGDRGRDLGDVAHLAGEIASHEVDAIGQVLPGTGYPAHIGLAAEPALGADLAAHPRHLRGEGIELVHHGVDGVLELQDLPTHVDRDLPRQVAVGDRGRDLGDVSHLAGEVAGHKVDVIGQVLPGARDTLDDGLTAELALGAHLARHARHLGGKGVQLVDHDIDGILELEDLALGVRRDLLREVASGNGRGDLGDVSYLAGEVARHEVDVVGQVLPGARDALDDGLSAELAFGAHLASHACDFGGETIELTDHGVDGLGGAQELTGEPAAVDIEGHGLAQVPVGHRPDDPCDLGGGLDQIDDEIVDRIDAVAPGPFDAVERSTLGGLPFLAHDATDAPDLFGKLGLLLDHIVQRIRYLAWDPGVVDRHADGEIAFLQGGQNAEQLMVVRIAS